ncbi:hypothetical protein NP493_5314g00002 [Ridgeia piscesae]|uniref:Uncharacterized protein n=1 Tax=Ridgeia piscesae TaxID=27915 RepID=A0AAD9IVG3_RIDPI|nr:hypothetical protein NP493_5314g00002 [Ridgeia piscesae]
MMKRQTTATEVSFKCCFECLNKSSNLLVHSAFNSTAYISIVQLVQLVFDNWKVSIITSQSIY